MVYGRKPGSYQWYEIQDNVAYYKELEKPKIIYPEITKFLPFVYDEDQYYINNKTFFIVGEHLQYLTAFLNSKLFKTIFKGSFPDLGEDRAELRKIFFEQVSIMKPTGNCSTNFHQIVDLIINHKRNGLDTQPLEREIDLAIYAMYNLNDADIKAIQHVQSS